MGCILPILSIFCPRLVIIVIAICTNWFSRAYDNMFWPVLGFIFMPVTTLAYMAAMLNNDHHVSGMWLILIILAVLFDLGGQGSSASRKSD